jgi:hypothetical protein
LLLLCNYVLLLLADVYKAAWTVRRASKWCIPSHHSLTIVCTL